MGGGLGPGRPGDCRGPGAPVPGGAASLRLGAQKLRLSPPFVLPPLPHPPAPSTVPVSCPWALLLEALPPWAAESVASWLAPRSRPGPGSGEGNTACAGPWLPRGSDTHRGVCRPGQGRQGRGTQPAPSFSSLCFVLTGGSAQTAPVGPGGQALSSRAAPPQLTRCDVPALPWGTRGAALCPSLSGLRPPDVSFLSGAEESGRESLRRWHARGHAAGGLPRPVVQEHVPRGPRHQPSPPPSGPGSRPLRSPGATLPGWWPMARTEGRGTG